MGEAAQKLEFAPFLLVDTASGETYALFDGFRVGRNEGDLRLARDGQVSNKHCVFHCSGKAVEVEDVGSRNGVFVGGRRIEAHVRLALLPGVRVEIGAHIFVIQAVAAVSAAPAAAPAAAAEPKAADPASPAVQLASLGSQLAPVTVKMQPVSAPRATRKPGDPILLQGEGKRTIGTGSISRTIPNLRQVRMPVDAPAPLWEPQSPAIAYALLALNVLVFGVFAARGVDLLNPTPAHLIAMGGNINGLTTGGQWWRLLSATFAHAGVGHLISNMAALLFLGVPMARLLGTARFGVMYVCAGLVGSVASIAFNPPNVVSVGASGSVFGVVGALLALQLIGRFRAQALGVMGGMATLQFVVRNIGVGVEGIDVAAHAGGLAAGFVLTYLLQTDGGDRDRWRPVYAGAGGVLLALVLACFVPHRQMPAVASPQAAPVAGGFLQKMNGISVSLGKIQAQYKDTVQDMKTGKLSEKDFLTQLKGTYLPGTDKALEQFQAVPVSTDGEKDARAAEVEYVTLWRAQLAELAAYMETKDEAHVLKLEELQKKMAEANARLDKAISGLRKP